ncbi:glutamine amidotransferase [Leifsonia sp. NPDC058230]|uniref:glutamine amidotransferase n=1 Tax=Leifsonia sp. NPDC058230 TaxID=3346391 RepID=UPI0036DC6728
MTTDALAGVPATTDPARPARTALVLQHDPSIHLGNIGPVLREHGYDVRVVDVAVEDVATIDPSEPDLVVVLGGEMGAYETDEFPFLAAEQSLLQQRIREERPTLGVCLGAQLIAGALGERVYKGDTMQIGYRRVQTTEAGAGSPIRHFDGVPVVEWHGDTFELPATATLLASSSDYSNEAFAIGRFTLAVQFHPEVTDQMHEQWVAEGYNELAEHALDADALRADRERYSAAMQDASQRAFSEWLSQLPSPEPRERPGRQRLARKKSSSSSAQSSASTPA